MLPSKFLETVTWKEYRFILESYNRRPFGEYRSDLRSAQIAYTTAATQGSKSDFKDFILNFKPRKILSFSEGAGIMSAWVTSLNKNKKSK